MGDVLDLEKRRASIREAVEKETPEGVECCPKCGDMFGMLVCIPDYTDVDELGPYALICQHCSEPYGFGFLFDEDDEDET